MPLIQCTAATPCDVPCLTYWALTLLVVTARQEGEPQARYHTQQIATQPLLCSCLLAARLRLYNSLQRAVQHQACRLPMPSGVCSYGTSLFCLCRSAYCGCCSLRAAAAGPLPPALLQALLLCGCFLTPPMFVPGLVVPVSSKWAAIMHPQCSLRWKP